MKISFFIVSAIMCGALAGCGDSSNSVNSVPLIVTMRSTAPVGLSVLSLGIQITNITLKGSSGTADAALTTNPLNLNLASVMTSSALLANTTAPAGTYSGIAITFTNPRLIVLNNSAFPFSDGTTSCASSNASTAPCSFSPQLVKSTETISSGAFPLTLTPGAPVNLALDFNTSNSIIGAAGVFSISPSVSATANTEVNATTNNIADFASVTGQVTAAGNNQLGVTDLATGQPLLLSANSNTTFNGFNTSSTCTTANTFNCLSAGQIVNFNFGISGVSGSQPNLTSVNLENGITNGITGTVIGQNAANQNLLVVTSLAPGFQNQNTGVAVGQVVALNPSNTATFRAQTNGATLASGLNFSSANNIGIGQSLTLNSTGFTPGVNGGPGTIGANNIILTPSQLSGTVGSINTSAQTFTVGGLNGLFNLNALPQLTVSTGTGTTFSGAQGFSGLRQGSVTMIGGLLFVTPAGEVIAGSTVGGGF